MCRLEYHALILFWVSFGVLGPPPESCNLKPTSVSLPALCSGNCGVSVDLPGPKQDPHGAMATLFAEELGLVMEVAASDAQMVLDAYKKAGVPAMAIGKVRVRGA